MTDGPGVEAAGPKPRQVEPPTTRLAEDRAPLPGEYEDAFRMVQQYNQTGSGFFLISVRRKFFDGDLITIGFRQNDGRDVQNFILKKGKNLELYRNESQILDGVARQSAAAEGLSGFLQSDNVPGLIALMIILCIVVLLIARPSDPKVPDVLSSGLALILGFYFGKRSS